MSEKKFLSLLKRYSKKRVLIISGILILLAVFIFSPCSIFTDENTLKLQKETVSIDVGQRQHDRGAEDPGWPGRQLFLQREAPQPAGEAGVQFVGFASETVGGLLGFLADAFLFPGDRGLDVEAVTFAGETVGHLTAYLG